MKTNKDVVQTALEEALKNLRAALPDWTAISLAIAIAEPAEELVPISREEERRETAQGMEAWLRGEVEKERDELLDLLIRTLDHFRSEVDHGGLNKDEIRALVKRFFKASPGDLEDAPDELVSFSLDEFITAARAVGDPMR